jgi:hypothetical protein
VSTHSTHSLIASPCDPLDPQSQPGASFSARGHCFGRSGATILADSVINKITLKRAGRWKSDTACDGYVEESKNSKIQITAAISGQAPVCKNSSENISGFSKIVNISGCTGSIVLNL